MPDSRPWATCPNASTRGRGGEDGAIPTPLVLLFNGAGRYTPRGMAGDVPKYRRNWIAALLDLAKQVAVVTRQ